MRFQSLGIALVEGGGAALAGQAKQAGGIIARGNGDRQQGLVAEAPAFDAGAVFQAIGGFLDIPFGGAFAAGLRRRIAEGADRAAAAGAGIAAPLFGAGGDQVDGLGFRTRDPHQGHGCRRAEEGGQRFAAGNVGNPFGRSQVELEILHRLARHQRDLEAADRQLGRGLAIVGTIPPAVDSAKILFGDQFRPLGIGAGFPPFLRTIGSFVPDVAAVERQPDQVLVTPQQPAHQAIAQRDRLIPGIDRRLQHQVLSGRRHGLGFGQDAAQQGGAGHHQTQRKQHHRNLRSGKIWKTKRQGKMYIKKGGMGNSKPLGTRH